MNLHEALSLKLINRILRGKPTFDSFHGFEIIHFPFLTSNLKKKLYPPSILQSAIVLLVEKPFPEKLITHSINRENSPNDGKQTNS